MSYDIEGYHGTRNITKVLKEGLKLGQDSCGNYYEPCVFLTSDIDEARKYARLAKKSNPAYDAGVVKVRIPRDKYIDGFLEFFEGFGSPETNEQILPDHPSKGQQWVVLGGKIPAKYITAVERVLRVDR